MKIHPSASVSPRAIIGDDVEIGADCVIQANAVIEGRTILGAGNFVGYGAILGAPPQDFAYEKGVQSETRIGDGNTFREYVTIHRGTKEGTSTVVGNGCFLMTGSHLGHNVRLGDRVIIANNCLLAGYVEVGDGAVLGGGTVFHQFMRIGALAMVRGGTRFGKDIPPYVSADGENMLSGINAVGLRRSGLSAEERQEIRRAFKLVYRSGLNTKQALERARATTWSPAAQAFFDFIAASKRGVCQANRLPVSGREGADGETETPDE